MQAVRLIYRAGDGREYQLNLIDTPGHVDFSYEVSRSLAACEGALLVVDAAQGIEAQTLANVYLALENNLEIIPVINKIDLPSAEPERVKQEIEDVIGLDASRAVLASAKSGLGIEEILERIVESIPPPAGAAKAPLRALIFDSHYDPYKGVIAYIRVVDGMVSKGMQVKMMATGKEFEVNEVGIFRPALTTVGELQTGEVGFCGQHQKRKDCQVGDTVTEAARPSPVPCPATVE